MNLKRSLKRLMHRAAFAQLDDEAFCRLSLERLQGLCAGRSVALVGNAQSLLETAYGAEIDRHDVVIRLNRGLVRNPDAQGHRTDMLGLACDMSLGEVREAFGDPALVWLTPIRELMASDVLARRSSIIVAPLGFWGELRGQLGSRPSAGLIMLAMLRQFGGCTGISLYGFDWKQSKTFYHSDGRHGRDRLKRGWHDWSAERALVQRLLVEDRDLELR